MILKSQCFHWETQLKKNLIVDLSYHSQNKNLNYCLPSYHKKNHQHNKILQLFLRRRGSEINKKKIKDEFLNKKRQYFKISIRNLFSAPKGKHWMDPRLI